MKLLFPAADKPNIAGQLLLYPESRVPFDTPAAVENNTGYYLECNGIFSFADHYTSKAPSKSFAPRYKYISPGMQSIEYLEESASNSGVHCRLRSARRCGC